MSEMMRWPRRWELIVAVMFVVYFELQISSSSATVGGSLKIGFVSDIAGSTQIRLDTIHQAIVQAQSEGLLSGYNIR